MASINPEGNIKLDGIAITFNENNIKQKTLIPNLIFHNIATYLANEDKKFLVELFAENGMQENAFNLAIQIPITYMQENSLTKTISYMNKDMGSKFLEMIDDISNPHAKYMASKELVMSFLRLDMPDDAIKAKEKIPKDYETSSSILQIVRKFVKLGRGDDAKNLVSQIYNSQSKQVALKIINNAKL